MEINETLKEQQNKKKSSRRKYILAAGLIVLFIISTLVFSLFQQEVRPDPDSEKIIRETAALTFFLGSNPRKEPNDLTDEDFAQIKDFRIPVIYFSPVSYTEMADIKLLEKFINIESLHLSFIVYPESSIPKWMKILSKYKIFNINNRFSIDLSPLEKMPKLQSLRLIQIPVKSIKPLAKLTHIKQLEIGHTQVSNLEPLRNLTNMEKLTAAYIPVTNIEPIKGLINLNELNLDGTKITNVEFLTGLTNLQKLSLSDTLISDLKPLKGLAKLRKLSIRDCKRITDEEVEGLQKALPELQIQR